MLINDRYEIECELEQGRRGTTYSAIDTQDGNRRRVTLTVFPADMSDRDWAAAFLSDFHVLRRLSHDNVAGVYESICDDARCYVTAEYIDGETLRNVVDQLQPEPLDPAEANEVVRAVGLAVAHAHAQGLAHGDLCLENVVVTADRGIKLIGFVASRSVGVVDFAEAAAADTAALAALAYELHSGVAPDGNPALSDLGQLRRYQAKALCAALERPGRTGVFTLLVRMGLVERAERPRPPASPRARRSWRVGFAAVGGAALALATFDGGGFGMLSARWPAVSDWIARPAPPPASGAAAAPAARNDGLREAYGIGARDLRRARAPAAQAAGRPELAPDARPAPPAGPPVALSDERLVVTEDETVAKLVVTLGATTDRAAIVWWTADGAAKAGDDYGDLGEQHAALERGAGGATSVALVVPIVSDAIAEPGESFFIHVGAESDGQGAAHFVVEVEIRDDDRRGASD